MMKCIKTALNVKDGKCPLSYHNKLNKQEIRNVLRKNVRFCKDVGFWDFGSVCGGAGADLECRGGGG